MLSVGGSIATTHLLVPARYAVIAYMGVGSGLMLTAGTSWTSSAVSRYGREELEHTGGMRSVVWARVFITVPTMIVCVVLACVLKVAGWLPAELTWIYLCLTLAIGLLGVAGEQVIVALSAFGEMRPGARAGAMRQVLLFVGMVTLLAIADGRHGSTQAVAWLIFGVAVVIVGWLVRRVGRHALWPPLLDVTQMRRVLAFSVPMIAFAASQYVLSSVDIIVLRAFRPASVVGAYALAYSGFSTLTSLAGSLTVVLVPLFVSLSTAGRSHVVVRYFQFLMPIAIFGVSVVGGMLAPVSASLIPLVFGAGFGSAAEPFAILVAGAMMLVIASCAAPIMMLHERTGATAMISTVALLVNVVGDLVLVGWVGASGYGPALATTAAMALTAVGYVVVASRDLGVMPSVNPLTLLPLAAGIVPTVMGRAAIGIGSAAVAAALVLVFAPPFRASDAEMLREVSIPAAIRSPLIRLIVKLGR